MDNFGSVSKEDYYKRANVAGREFVNNRAKAAILFHPGWSGYNVSDFNIMNHYPKLLHTFYDVLRAEQYSLIGFTLHYKMFPVSMLIASDFEEDGEPKHLIALEKFVAEHEVTDYESARVFEEDYTCANNFSNF